MPTHLGQPQPRGTPLYVDKDPLSAVIRWENLSNGDLDSIEEYQPDESVASVAKALQRRYPKIRWRIRWAGMDFDDGSGRQWRVICVPDGEWARAERLLDKWLSRSTRSRAE